MALTFDPCKPLKTRGGGRGSKLTLYETTVGQGQYSILGIFPLLMSGCASGIARKGALLPMGPLTMTDRLNATSQRSLLSILALLAALPRLLLVLAAPWVSKDPFGGTGHDGYLQVATRIATDATFALAPHHLLSRPPLYPLLLAPGIIFGIPFVWTASLQILLGVMTVLFVFLAVCEVSRSQSMAFACAAWVAVNPWLIWFTKNPMTPVTSTFIMSVLVLVYVKGLRSHKIAISQFSAVGALAALAALAHPALLPVVAGVALSLF